MLALPLPLAITLCAQYRKLLLPYKYTIKKKLKMKSSGLHRTFTVSVVRKRNQKMAFHNPLISETVVGLEESYVALEPSKNVTPGAEQAAEQVELHTL